jgi:2-dehydro-3-deoxyphosphogluconate aldolase / (4S)-4-hydroxy-2-oxoglutarate aldolase
MASKQQTLDRMSDSGVVAVIRAPHPDVLVPLTEALVAGGVLSIEVTMSTPKAIVGVGTVIDAATAADAMRAGAQFVVSPITDARIIETVIRQGKVIVPGAFTPTEIVNAWTLGGDVIKVFPSTALGPNYFKDILAPLPQLKLTPTGGVDLKNVGQWIKAGAVCVGVGSALVTKDAMANKDWPGIQHAAKQFTDAVKAARS